MSDVLEFAGVSVVRGDNTLLDDITWEVEEGQRWVILGPNGAGKTTLYNLLTGFIPPDSGSILFKGRSLSRLAPYRIAGLGISRTFQLCRPFVGMTVFENVVVGGLGAHSADRTGLAARALAAGNQHPPMTLRADVSRVSAAQYIAELAATGRVGRTLDGYASAVLLEHPALAALPRLSLNAPEATRYRAIRAARRADQVSTLEATVQALAMLERTSFDAGPLLDAFGRFVDGVAARRIT